MSYFVGPAPDDSCIVNVDLLLSIHLLPGDVQRRIAVKVRRYYLVQLVECRRDICYERIKVEIEDLNKLQILLIILFLLQNNNNIIIN